MTTYNSHAMQLAELLEQLTIADNSTRQAAEAQYNIMKEDDEADLPLMLLSVLFYDSLAPICLLCN